MESRSFRGSERDGENEPASEYYAHNRNDKPNEQFLFL